ncbi:MAG: prepilin-type N-terminal cleavage/methylation domain-containing protein [Nitrospirae bacterium]|nr:prepilin-type N-terminal cleavage/methylation domain-containing protein [Nitrospirota bacterium]
MRWTRDKKGVTLVELMITLVIFTIIISMIYSVYNAFLKQATSERKTAKTEMDVINVSWPLIKEIQSAGFGVPSFSCSPDSYRCSCGLAVVGNDLIIHSTAAGDSEHAGKWSYISGSTCGVTGLPNATTDPGENNVVVTNNTDKSRLGTTTVAAGNTLASCGSNESNIAYWYNAGGDIECYETIYALDTYDAGARPAMCESNTRRLSRSSRTIANAPIRQTILDCVFGADTSTPADTGFNYRFGCISAAGALTWQTGTDCGTSKLRLVKIGVVVQSSTRRDIQSPATITLFEGLRDSTGASLEVALDLTTQRDYKWRKIEQTIILKNLE